MSSGIITGKQNYKNAEKYSYYYTVIAKIQIFKEA